MSAKSTPKAKKQEYGIVRNGEHIERDFSTVKAAEAKIEVLKAQDVKMAEVGWFPMSSALAVHYYAEEIKDRVW